MPILKDKIEGNYAIIPQSAMHDHRLGLTERGLLATLLSLPNEWEFTISGLQQILPNGKNKISNALSKLIDLGYVTKEQDRENVGRYGVNKLIIHEIPVKQTRYLKMVEGSSKKSTVEKPMAGNPPTDKMETDKTPTEKLPQVINNKVNNNKVINQESGLSDAEYNDLIQLYGKEEVDYQIRKINERHYRGCMNTATISKWCQEHKTINPVPVPIHGKNKFGFEQHDYDFEKLEKELLAN